MGYVLSSTPFVIKLIHFIVIILSLILIKYKWQNKVLKKNVKDKNNFSLNLPIFTDKI